MAKKNNGQHEPYSKLPHHIQFSPAFRSLSGTARALLLDVIARERGNNNGDLLVTFTTFIPLGWKSNGVFRNALAALVASGLLVVTKEGRQRTAARYALSWLTIMKNGYNSKENPEKLRTGNRTANGFSSPESGPHLDRIPAQSQSGIRTVSPKSVPESGPKEGGLEGLAVRNPDWVACCQGGAENNGPTEEISAKGEGQPMTIYVAESNGAFSLSVRPSIQRERTILCADAREPDAVMAAARRALEIATQHKAVLRLVGATEALAAFDPILAAAKASEGAKP